jgi:hypothetical protein
MGAAETTTTAGTLWATVIVAVPVTRWPGRAVGSGDPSTTFRVTAGATVTVTVTKPVEPLPVPPSPPLPRTAEARPPPAGKRNIQADKRKPAKTRFDVRCLEVLYKERVILSVTRLSAPFQRRRPVALRPHLAMGLPLSWIVERWGEGHPSSGGQ